MKIPPRTLVAIITPFAEDGTIDTAAHEHNVGALLGQGCTGFVVAGSTGEGPYLSADERATLVAATRAVSDAVYTMAGINAESVEQAEAQITACVAAGADAVLALTPTTLVRNKHSLVAFFYRSIADVSPIPVLLYSNPNVTGYELPTDIIVELAAHPNIVGIKDSGGNPERIDDLTDIIADGFIVYPGASRALLASHAKGAFGAITASANYAFDLVDRAGQGDAAAQDALLAKSAVVESHGIPGTKAAASIAGLASSSPRLPLLAVSRESYDDMAAAIGNTQAQ
jgi:4-hydroxy-2-oxoglutarate aldolase